MPSPPTRFGLAASLAAGLGILAAWLPAASAGQGHDRPGDDALQAVADAVLIETRCRPLTVDYDKLFAYAERNGIDSAEIMPTGPRRAAFEAAYRRRDREADTEQLCGSIAADRAALIPGLFLSR